VTSVPPELWSLGPKKPSFAEILRLQGHLGMHQRAVAHGPVARNNVVNVWSCGSHHHGLLIELA
jgi:hypothetical protein